MKLFLRSFVYAAHGIKYCLLADRNFAVHCVSAVAAIIAGFLLKIGAVEWMIISINIVLVIGFEMLNTSIEKICDLVQPEQHPLVKIIKDVAAGAVLLVAVGAAICAAIIFLPKLF